MSFEPHPFQRRLLELFERGGPVFIAKPRRPNRDLIARPEEHTVKAKRDLIKEYRDEAKRDRRKMVAERAVLLRIAAIAEKHRDEHGDFELIKRLVSDRIEETS